MNSMELCLRVDWRFGPLIEPMHVAILAICAMRTKGFLGLCWFCIRPLLTFQFPFGDEDKPNLKESSVKTRQASQKIIQERNYRYNHMS
jgi:hypothetical protein